MKLPNQSPAVICAKALIVLLTAMLNANPETVLEGAALTVITSVMTDVMSEKGNRSPDDKDQDQNGKGQGGDDPNPKSASQEGEDQVTEEDGDQGEKNNEDDQQ